ncbi:plant UBX domain-containing protein 2-like [Cucurbita moschata]|uniref:Plant UBX domain-containing protein 2-like n=1 Tax=Cucurbita moschata TaxID=3662 RepID=A0A6J1GMV3_CUCMO|nr:plant UBX domain-containing protein 2-like [Cucurbita moschata]
MGDVKDKVKGFMKRFNNPLSSSSSTSFKGQGRVLGSSSSGSTTSLPTRPLQNPISNPNLAKPPVANSISAAPTRPHLSIKSTPERSPADGFDPFDSFITSGKKSGNGYSLNVFECPICGQNYRSEEEVSVHVDSCVDDNTARRPPDLLLTNDAESPSELEGCLGIFLSGKPSQGSLKIILTLLRNIIREPENSKFRKIRLSNPKIKEAIGEAVGGVELLEFVGFKLQEQDGEMWATMEVPTEEQINILSKVIDSIDQPKLDEQEKKGSSTASTASTDQLIEPKKVDRQTRVFFAIPENVAANIELPDSFYKLSVEEVKREAVMRKQKIAESQLLVPKSYKEKQAKAARRKYNRTVIRIQFPDGVVLQGIFSPWEPTSALYEFVSTALKEPSLEFELIQPVGVKRRAIAHFPAVGEKAKTLDDLELVPSALVKFRPIETDAVVFTGLCNELLEIIEPLVSGSAVAPPAQG